MDKLERMLNLILETMGIDATPFQGMKTDLFKKNTNKSQPVRTENRIVNKRFLLLTTFLYLHLDGPL